MILVVLSCDGCDDFRSAEVEVAQNDDQQQQNDLSDVMIQCKANTCSLISHCSTVTTGRFFDRMTDRTGASALYLGDGDESKGIVESRTDMIISKRFSHSISSFPLIDDRPDP